MSSLDSSSSSLHRHVMQRELSGISGFKTTRPFKFPQSGKILMKSPARHYCGTFSDNGRLFVTAKQDFTIDVFDARNPYLMNSPSTTIQAAPGRWTLTDCQVSSDAIVYSSITPVAHFARLPESGDYEKISQTPLNFDPHDDDNFGIWSLRFSKDGKEICAGTSDCSIRVIDVETGRLLVNVPEAHMDDINSVCFADKSGNLLLSASDDCSIKLWDRRSLRGGTASGMFLGHTEGLTFVDSDGDRFFVSNGKDQAAKVWDIRKSLPANTDLSQTYGLRRGNWDYRFMAYRPEWQNRRHPQDCSIQTLRGHQVLQTLIRVRFLPTNPNIVYSGSSDGKVRYWDTISGDLLHTLDAGSILRNQPMANIEDPAFLISQYLRRYTGMGSRRAAGECVVRDVSVHPHHPELLATSCFSAMPLDSNEGAVVLFGNESFFSE